MNNKGFTLMEILAVLLILAVVVLFALPGIRAMRAEIYHMQAKSAAVKMVDALRSYYQSTKGGVVTGSLTGRGNGNGSVVGASTGACSSVGETGIPNAGGATATDLAELFACGYLTVKDFSGLPYTFTSSLAVSNHGNGVIIPNDGVLVRAIGTAEAGRYSGEGWCVYRDGSAVETNGGACPA